MHYLKIKVFVQGYGLPLGSPFFVGPFESEQLDQYWLNQLQFKLDDLNYQRNLEFDSGKCIEIRPSWMAEIPTDATLLHSTTVEDVVGTIDDIYDAHIRTQSKRKD